jgi:hypothetical protein
VPAGLSASIELSGVKRSIWVPHPASRRKVEDGLVTVVA